MRRPSRVLVVCLCLALGLTAGVARAQEIRNVSWPSLDSQLAADRVVLGSPLQQLIEANQDFQLLRPEEANDKIPVPLWLRVLWRKKHPHLEYLASDRTGGYPHLLKEIHEWMTSHQDLLPGFPDEDVPPPTLARVGVGVSERRISSFSESRSESDIRVNFWDPSKVIAASNNVQGSGRQAQYYSNDGGQTWGETTLPFVSQDSFHSDPTVDWTSDGMAWSTTIGVTEDGEDLRLRLYRSADNGATWVFDSTISGSQTEADKQMAWIDHSPTSPHLDNLYVIWHNGRPVYMNRKTRNGAWGTPIKVSGSETTGTGIGADVKTNSAGVVFGFWPDTGSRKIYMVRSTNGGVSYSRPKAIAATSGSYDIGVPAMNGRRVLLYVSAGTYRSTSRDMVYLVWTDFTGAQGCRADSNEPGSNTNSSCKTRIWFTRSTDGGNTWSAKRMINNQAGKNDQLNPALAVDEKTGQVAVIYYDTAGESRKKTNVWYQSSTDHGATWSSPFKVTAAATDETAASADTGNQYGDYNGLSGYAGTFFPVWTDRRGNGSEQIWTAALKDQAGGGGGGGGGTCTTVALYNQRFDSVNGLAGWARGVFDAGSDSLDWRGVAACPAKSGSKVFRFGGSGCTSDYGNNRFAFAQPGGAAGIAVPAGATQVRLSFWHRFDFEEDADGGLIALSLDGQSYTFAANAALSGSRYNGVIDSSCAPEDTNGLPIFTGEQRSYVNTVVDLDALCNAVTGGSGGCAGRAVRIGFTAVSDCLLTDDGWSLDDVQVTACVP
ncbi:MAG TPA: exo-alpha-sialidase [Thermoanaerobaculia bacterium]|nr:exo-alpha-sialidase [Thermoanaerobaculia bacterium]